MVENLVLLTMKLTWQLVIIINKTLSVKDNCVIGVHCLKRPSRGWKTLIDDSLGLCLLSLVCDNHTQDVYGEALWNLSIKYLLTVFWNNDLQPKESGTLTFCISVNLGLLFLTIAFNLKLSHLNCSKIGGFEFSKIRSQNIICD